MAGPQVPREVAHLWWWFLELERTTQMAEFGPQALTYCEIAAWAALMDRQPLPHEVDALLDLDRAFRVVVTEK